MKSIIKNILLSAVAGDGKEIAARATITAAWAGLLLYLNAILIPVIALMFVMVCDYLTGSAKAWATKAVSSRVGVIGVIKKLGYLIMVVVAGIVDWLIISGIQAIGVSIQLNFYVGFIVCIWLILVELISILENLAVLGAPVPPFLSKLVSKLKNVVESKTESEDK